MFMKKKSVTVIFSLVTVLLLLVALYYFIRKSNKEGFTSNVKVTYYFMPECPWCKAFMSEWQKFVALAKKEGYTTMEVDATDPANQKAVQEKGIKGFPSVIVTKGKDVEYSGERTAEDLNNFVKKLP